MNHVKRTNYLRYLKIKSEPEPYFFYTLLPGFFWLYCWGSLLFNCKIIFCVFSRKTICYFNIFCKSLDFVQFIDNEYFYYFLFIGWRNPAFEIKKPFSKMPKGLDSKSLLKYLLLRIFIFELSF